MSDTEVRRRRGDTGSAASSLGAPPRGAETDDGKSGSELENIKRQVACFCYFIYFILNPFLSGLHFI